MSTSPSEALTVTALYFDGHSARAWPATLSLDGDALLLAAEGLSRRAPLVSLRLSEPMGAAPRLITFDDGAHAEVRDHAALARLLGASGQRDRLTVRSAFDLRMVAGALALLVVVLWGAARYGLPWAAEVAAPRVPEAVVTGLSRQTLELIDEHMLAPSTLADAEQSRLRSVLAGRTTLSHALVFRHGGAVGPNAFALPDGTLVVTDELIELAGDDERVMAVLMHELGHVERRHGMRMLLQGSVVALFMTWYAGDVSSVIAMAPTALIQSGYSRDMEREADDYAAAALRAQGRSPALLADMLQRLSESADRGRKDGGGWLDSHPDSAQRIERLRDRP